MKTLRIEICENAFWLLLWTMVSLFIATTIFVCSHYYTKRITAAFDSGYIETESVRGSIIWGKPALETSKR